MLSKQKTPVCQVYYYQYQKLKTKEQRRKDDLMKSRNPRGIWYVDEQSYKQIQKIEIAEKAEEEKRKFNKKVEEEREMNINVVKVKDQRRRRMRLQDEESFQSYKEKYNDLYEEHTLMKKKLEDLEKMVKNKYKYINALNKAFKDVFEQKKALSKKPEQEDVFTQTEHLMSDFGVQCQPEMTSKYIGTERKYFKGREVQTEKVKGREFSCQTKAININKVEIGTMATQTSSTCVEMKSAMTDSSQMVTDQTPCIPLSPIETNNVGTMTTQTLSTCVEMKSTMTDSSQMVTDQTPRIPLSPIETNDVGTMTTQTLSTCVEMTDSSLMVTDQIDLIPLIPIEKNNTRLMEIGKISQSLIKQWNTGSLLTVLLATEKRNDIVMKAITSTKNDGICRRKLMFPSVNIIGTTYAISSPTISHSGNHTVRYRNFDLQLVYIIRMFQFKISFYEMKMIFDKLYLILIKFMQMYYRQRDIPIAEVSIATAFIPHDCSKHQKQINCLTSNVLPQGYFNGKINLDDIIDIQYPEKQMKRQKAVHQNIDGCMMRTFCLNQRMINLIRIFLVYVKIIKYHGKMLLLSCVSVIGIGWNVLQIIRLLTYICKTINVDILRYLLFTNLLCKKALIFTSKRYTVSFLNQRGQVTVDPSKRIIDSQMVTINVDILDHQLFTNVRYNIDAIITSNRLFTSCADLSKKQMITNMNVNMDGHWLGSLGTYNKESLNDPSIIHHKQRSTSKKSNCFVRLYKSLKRRRKVKTMKDDDEDNDDDNLPTTHCFNFLKSLFIRK